ncbi:MAG: hypothetical protein D6788_04285 [Planctomycetota bacterium]|nr:MAG: hypothetical protein D6788_04285 [Planctomycetota bacterium]
MAVTCQDPVPKASCTGTWVEGATCPEVPGCDAHMVVLLDRTGSMNAIRCETGSTRCEDALMAAQSDVDHFFNTHSAGSSLAVWTFANDGPVDLTGGFVTDRQVARDALAPLEGVPCDGWTPLAEAMCDAVDSLVATFPSAPPKSRILAVSSDGQENFSDANCAGPDSVGGDSCGTFDEGSWQRQVCERIVAHAIAQVRHWGAFIRCDGVAGAAIDVETGQALPARVPDRVFFAALAEASGGTYLALSDASPPPPPGPPPFGVTGACCLPDGTCEEAITEAECAVLGGTHRGQGVTCAEAQCFLPVPALPPWAVAVGAVGLAAVGFGLLRHRGAGHGNR